MPTQAEVRDLITKVNQTKKYKVVKSGSRHHKVVHAEGPNKNKPVTDANGPLIISGSPGETRFREMTVKRLVAAKVLPGDPYKATESGPQNGNGNGGKEKRKSPLSDPEQAERIHRLKLEAIRVKSDKAKEETAKLRSRLEPVVVHLGGWGDRGGRFNLEIDFETRRTGRTLSLMEFGAVARFWAETRGRMEAPRVKGTTTIVDAKVFAQAASNLKMPGHTLGDVWRPFWTVFIDELYARAGSGAEAPKKAASRYWELYREMRGLVPGSTTPPSIDTPPILTPKPEPAESPEPQQLVPLLGPAHDVSIPHLALEAMYLMARGADADYDQAMKVAERIAKMEMGVST